MNGGRRHHALRMHPADAAARGLADGALVRIRSAAGQVEVPVLLTDEMTPGVVALPHGWGHRGGWRVANAAGGVNSNRLMDAAPESLERLAGMSHLNGVAVEVTATGNGSWGGRRPKAVLKPGPGRHCAVIGGTKSTARTIRAR